MAVSKALKAIVLIVIIVAAVFGVYAAVTFPRTVVSFPVSFTAGITNKHEEFDVPWLHGLVQVEVKVQSGTAMWFAKITSGDEIIWSHHGSGDYVDHWIGISPGRYNFTFWIGGGSLNAEIRVITKGGFW